MAKLGAGVPKTPEQTGNLDNLDPNAKLSPPVDLNGDSGTSTETTTQSNDSEATNEQITQDNLDSLATNNEDGSPKTSESAIDPEAVKATPVTQEPTPAATGSILDNPSVDFNFNFGDDDDDDDDAENVPGSVWTSRSNDSGTASRNNDQPFEGQRMPNLTEEYEQPIQRATVKSTEPVVVYKHRLIRNFQVGRFHFVNHLMPIHSAEENDEWLECFDGLMDVDKNNIVEYNYKAAAKLEQPVSNLSSRSIRGALSTKGIPDQKIVK
jgi:hypothetical protein